MRNFKFVLIFLFISSLTYSQLSKGNRQLAYQVDLAENGNYDSAIMYAKDACMESVHLFFTWNNLQTDTNSFNQSFVTSYLDLINLYHPLVGLKAELQMATINTVSKSVPVGLDTINFSSPTMIRHFKEALDTVFAHIPDLELSALNIGNEADIYWGIDSVKYVDYSIFIDSISAYAKQKYNALHGQDLKVGVTLTHHGLIAPTISNYCKIINSKTDIISTTYYPLENNFTMKPTSVVATDFGDLVNEYPDTTKPIYFAECGYSSSDICNSSESQQAQFYEEVFDSWDTYQANIKYLTIFKTNDWSHSEVAALVPYYGITDTTFYEYLRTLGVRTYPGNGENKLAYETIKCELNARNWCSTSCNQSTNIHEEINKSTFNIYPNPFIDEVKISANHSILKAELINLTGKVIHSNSKKFNHLGHLNSGIYFVRVYFIDGTFQEKKLIKL